MTVILAIVAITGLLAVWLRHRYLIVKVVGSSMAPTFCNGERVLAVRPSTPARFGQVVLIRGNEGLLIKRVAGVAGDIISFELAQRSRLTIGDRIPDGHVIILGDNPEASLDSRYLGYVSARRIVGSVVRKLSS